MFDADRRLSGAVAVAWMAVAVESEANRPATATT